MVVSDEVLTDGDVVTLVKGVYSVTSRDASSGKLGHSSWSNTFL